MLQWSDEREPNGYCSYTHCVAETPLGEIRIEWKGWKEYDDACGQMPWGEYFSFTSVDEAKEEVQLIWDRQIEQAAEFCTKGPARDA